jgi:hypothetical protein
MADLMKRSTLPYVVQEHHEGRVCHWDLMLHRPVDTSEADDRVLATWAMEVQPTGGNLARPISGRPLPDHRRAYLSYEGPIRGGERGWCQIVDRGTFELREFSDTAWRVIFEGEHLRGEYILEKSVGENVWMLVKIKKFE